MKYWSVRHEFDGKVVTLDYSLNPGYKGIRKTLSQLLPSTKHIIGVLLALYNSLKDARIVTKPRIAFMRLTKMNGLAMSQPSRSSKPITRTVCAGSES